MLEERARFRILRGAKGGANFFAGCKRIRVPAHNQYQIITFLILKTDNRAKLRIELKSILFKKRVTHIEN